MRKALLALIAVFSIACSDGVTGVTTVTGNWTLRSVNGSALPYTVPGTGTVIVDDVVSLYEGFTYARTGHSRVTVGGQVTNVNSNDTGTYSLMGNAVFLRSNDPTKMLIVANVSGFSMTISDAATASIYMK